MSVNETLTDQRRLIAGVRPDLAAAPLVEVRGGPGSRVVFAGDAVFRFPRDGAAARRIGREPALLRLVAGCSPVPVPRPILHDGVREKFSERVRIPGTTVGPATYHGFDDEKRERLAADLAATYAALHRIDPDAARAAGAEPVGAWADARDVFARLASILDPPLLGAAARVLSAAATLPDDEVVFGHFHTHGDSMAVDAATGRLVGLFDFADAGIGPLHRDFSFLCFVAPDLAARVVRRYVSFTRRRVVLERVFTLHAWLLLAEASGGAERCADSVWMVTDFLAAVSRFRGETLAEELPGERTARRAGAW